MLWHPDAELNPQASIHLSLPLAQQERTGEHHHPGPAMGLTMVPELVVEEVPMAVVSQWNMQL